MGASCTGATTARSWRCRSTSAVGGSRATRCRSSPARWPAERLPPHVPGAQGAFEGAVSPDGRTLVFRVDTPDRRRDIWWVSLGGDSTPHPIAATAAEELMPRLSPDGRWLAYASDESGRSEVYVRPFPGPGGRAQISAAGGAEPVWSPDGARLLY